MRSVVLFVICLISIVHCFGQKTSNVEKNLFPDILGYHTLICDFHMHTVFSDGDVWPTVRVQEAEKEGVHAIAITDHIEYLPNKMHIPNENMNSAYEVACSNESDVVVINGAEITRDMPPGHINSIFVEDVNKLTDDDVRTNLIEAKRQGGFSIWNHPHWIAQNATGIAELIPVQVKFVEDDLVQGIEIVNEHAFSDEAFQIAIDHNLAIIGGSDIHGLVEWDYHLSEGGHRPATLVFSENGTKEGIIDALQNRRTVVWFNEMIIGHQLFIIPLIEASLQVVEVAPLESYKGASKVQRVILENRSAVDYILQNRSAYRFHSDADVITIPANSQRSIDVKTSSSHGDFKLSFDVLNAIYAPEKHPEITIDVKE